MMSFTQPSSPTDALDSVRKMQSSHTKNRISCIYSSCNRCFIDEKAMKKHLEEDHKQIKRCPFEKCVPRYSANRKNRIIFHMKDAHGLSQHVANELARLVEEGTPYEKDIVSTIPAHNHHQHVERCSDIDNQQCIIFDLKLEPVDKFEESLTKLRSNTRNGVNVQRVCVELQDDDLQAQVYLCSQNCHIRSEEAQEFSDIFIKHFEQHNVISIDKLNSLFQTDGSSNPTQDCGQKDNVSVEIAQSSQIEQNLSPKYLDLVQCDENMRHQEAMTMKSNVPLTDSGYQSARHMKQIPDLQLGLEKPPCLIDVKYPLAVDQDQDTRTWYSIGTIMNPYSAHILIIDLSNNICDKLEQFVDHKERSMLSAALPELIKAFAIKICHDSPSQTHRDIMFFLYKHHMEVSTQVEMMLNHDDEDEENLAQRSLGGMSPDQKVDMWNMKADYEPSPIPGHELFEGVADEVEDWINEGDISTHQNIILNCEAYKWFLESLKTESIQQLGTSQARLRHKILKKLPTGTISKRQNPTICEITFNLEWQYIMEQRLSKMSRPMPENPDEWFLSSIILTGSSQELQGVTVKQYLAQTWPIIGLKVFGTIQTAVTDAGKVFKLHLPGATELEVKATSSYLIITVTGTAYFVAECGEVIAWIGSALHSDAQTVSGYCTPSFSSFSIDFGPSQTISLKYTGSCAIKVEVAQVEASDNSLESLIEDAWGKHFGILGFPILRRPDGYPGLELPFDILLRSLQAGKVDIVGKKLSIAGRKWKLRLVKTTQNIFLWHLIHPSAKNCLCSMVYSKDMFDDEIYGPASHHVLETGRHILAKCRGHLSLVQDTHQVSEKPNFTNTKVAQSPLFIDSGPVEDPTTLSYNQNAARSDERLDDWILETNKSILENVPMAIQQEIMPSASISSKDTNLSSPSCQSEFFVGSSDDSLDSALFSISDGSEYVQPLNFKKAAYAILCNFLPHHLFSGFRNAMQYQSCPGENTDAAPSTSTSTTGSSQIGESLRNSLKRNLQQQSGDNNEEDGSLPPPAKKKQSSQNEILQRLFACPYLKFDPMKHKKCCRMELTGINYVKQHLIRQHYSTRYCQKCQDTSFPDERSLQTHIQVANCSYQDPSSFELISHEQRTQLSRKSRSKISKEDQWFAIWEILFPGCQKPNSVYLDAALTLEMIQFREHCYNYGPTILREHIESDLFRLRTETTEEQFWIYLNRVFTQGLNNLIENWGLNQSSASLSVSLAGSIPDIQQSRYQTSTGSNTDSGVVLGSQSPFRELSFRRSELAPTPVIPEMSSLPVASNYRAQNQPIVQEGAAPQHQTYAESRPSILLSPTFEGQEENSYLSLEDDIALHPGLDPELFNMEEYQGLENLFT